jgi:hypothetical protein
MSNSDSKKDLKALAEEKKPEDATSDIRKRNASEKILTYVR